MINREIFTESPEDDLWRELLQYSYRANVSRYLKKHSLVEDEVTINTIIGSFLQANEYFKASKSEIFRYRRYFCIMEQLICYWA